MAPFYLKKIAYLIIVFTILKIIILIIIIEVLGNYYLKNSYQEPNRLFRSRVKTDISDT